MEKSHEIANEIDGYKERLDQDFSDLKLQVQKSTDWRTYYEKNPWMFVGGAAVGGLVLAELFGGRRAPSGPSASYGAPAGGVVSDVVSALKVALVGFGTAKAKEFLGEVLPGFDEHMRQNGAGRL